MIRLFGTGFAVGLSQLTNFEFDPNCSHTFCRICGNVFQSRLDRKEDKTDEEAFRANEMRRHWSLKHARKHSAHEHLMLEASGMFLTVEASYVLAAFGVIPITDMMYSEEHRAALAESSPIPIYDADQ